MSEDYQNKGRIFLTEKPYFLIDNVLLFAVNDIPEHPPNTTTAILD